MADTKTKTAAAAKKYQVEHTVISGGMRESTDEEGNKVLEQVNLTNGQIVTEKELKGMGIARLLKLKAISVYKESEAPEVAAENTDVGDVPPPEPQPDGLEEMDLPTLRKLAAAKGIEDAKKADAPGLIMALREISQNADRSPDNNPGT